VKVHCLRPHVVSLALSDELGDQESLLIGSDVVHKSVGSVFGVHYSQVGDDTVVSSLEGEALFEEGDEFLIVAKLLVELFELLEMIWLDDNSLSTKSSHAEFLSPDASEANSFPDLRDVGLLGGIEGILELLEHDVGLCEFLVVADSLE